jgi:hypothetical protein
MIAPLGDAFARGSLQLDFVGAPMGVGAILSTMNQQSSLVVEALLHSPMEFVSTQVQAVWSAPDRDARINWRIHDGAQIAGRTQVLSLSSAIAHNRSCGGCTCQPTQITVSMANFTDNADGTAFTSVQETDSASDEPGFPYTVPNYYFAWSSDNEAVAIVDADGNVTYQGPGSATITALEFPDIFACQGPNPVDDGCNCPAVDPSPPVSDHKGVSPPIIVSVQFTGNKSTGDNLHFTGNLGADFTCSESLGLKNCLATSGYLLWNLEGKAVVNDDVSHWTVAQSLQYHFSGSYKDASNNLQPFSCTGSNPSDGPDPNFLQKPAGQNTIFWIDAPGPFYAGGVDPTNQCQTGSRAFDSITDVLNFQVTYHNTVTRYTITVKHFVKIVVAPGSQIDFTHSIAGYGNIS